MQLLLGCLSALPLLSHVAVQRLHLLELTLVHFGKVWRFPEQRNRNNIR